MRWLGIVVVVLMLSTFAGTPALAQDMTGCQVPTIDALEMCVQHAYSEGHISNLGVYQALLQQLETANARQSAGQTDAAVNILQAFIHTVQAQAGINIDEMHAEHMVMHAEMVIAALTG